MATRQKLEYVIARKLASLPPRVQIALSGTPQIQIDGQLLAPEQQLSLAVLNRISAKVAFDSVTPEHARRERRRMAAVFGGRPEPVGAVVDRMLDTPFP